MCVQTRRQAMPFLPTNSSGNNYSQAANRRKYQLTKQGTRATCKSVWIYFGPADLYQCRPMTCYCCHERNQPMLQRSSQQAAQDLLVPPFLHLPAS